jgi:hypothetical protein
MKQRLYIKDCGFAYIMNIICTIAICCISRTDKFHVEGCHNMHRKTSRVLSLDFNFLVVYSSTLVEVFFGSCICNIPLFIFASIFDGTGPE